MATYTIRAVAKEVKDYVGQYGPMKSYKIALTGPGVDPQEPVELSQKPETAPPTVGKQLEGTIQDTEFGKKFKKDFQAQRTSSSGGFGGKRDDDAIRAQWAIGQALGAVGNADDLLGVEALAIDLFVMVERVKNQEKAKVDTVFGESEPVADDDPFAGMELDGQ